VLLAQAPPDRVQGVHGPRNLDVIIVNKPEPASDAPRAEDQQRTG
jgi:hypothetical protein